jgi:hypothetical protein
MNLINPELIPAINQSLQLELQENISLERLEEILAAYVNELIQSDFQTLVSLLYRIDVNEIKLKNLLKDNIEKNAGKIIAGLIIERQLQKIKSRQQFTRGGKNTSEDESR